MVPSIGLNGKWLAALGIAPGQKIRVVTNGSIITIAPSALKTNLCAFAEFEREVIRERVNAGLAAARLRGVKFGRPSTLGRHEKAVAALLGEGLGVCAIARRLGIPLSSAHKVITSVRHVGPPGAD